ncbi:MAG: hypothetical protein RI885_1836, partial [Actinomycetota bacterium]
MVCHPATGDGLAPSVGAMRQRVTAIVVARSGAGFLERTLAAVGRQSRRPDAFIAVDVASTDNSAALLSASDASLVVAAPPGSSFGGAVAHALTTRTAGPADPAGPAGLTSRASGPAKPTGPGEATGPAEAAEPTGPGEAAGPAEAVGPAQAAGPAQAGGPAEAGRPDEATDRPDEATGPQEGTTRPAPPPTDDWLWLLGHDNAPHPDALARLLGAVEIAPSVAVAGPKLMQWDAPDVIAEYGESMTATGASLVLVGDELDQAQHDVQADVLGVAAGGMLVRREVWTELGGFDPGLPSIDSSLDFSVRARLAGHRVVVVPDARVASAGGPEYFGAPDLPESTRSRRVRSALLHRRMVYAPLWALPLHWLSLLPLALARSIVHLLGKRPAAVPGEFAAAFSAAVEVRGIRRSRRRLAASKRVGWSAIAPLRVSWRQASEQRVHRVERQPLHGPVAWNVERVGYVSGGGLWTLLATAVIGVIAFGTLIGAESVVGGGLLPLSADVGTLWSQVGWGHRDLGVGFTGAADPFAWVLAVLGTLVPTNPSAAVVGFYLLALPAASVGAWFCTRRFAVSAALPSIAAVLWAVAPPFLQALDGGRLGAAMAHVLLPWLVLLGVTAVRSWSAAAGAAVVMAVVAASAPSLIPALLLLLLVWTATHPRSAHRLVGIPLPAAMLFAPLLVDQVGRGFPGGILADPGVASGGATQSGIQLALGSADGGSDGWSRLLGSIALPGVAGPFVAAALLLPLGVLAVLALVTPGTRKAVPPLLVALMGFLTAVAASRIDLVSQGPDTVGLWPGSGLSLFWLGLIAAAMCALDALGRAASGSSILVTVSTVLVAVPLLSAGLVGALDVSAGTGRTLPAFVDAEATGRASVGTLVIDPVDEGAIATSLERGRG